MAVLLQRQVLQVMHLPCKTRSCSGDGRAWSFIHSQSLTTGASPLMPYRQPLQGPRCLHASLAAMAPSWLLRAQPDSLSLTKLLPHVRIHRERLMRVFRANAFDLVSVLHTSDHTPHVPRLPGPPCQPWLPNLCP